MFVQTKGDRCHNGGVNNATRPEHSSIKLLDTNCVIGSGKLIVRNIHFQKLA